MFFDWYSLRFYGCDSLVELLSASIALAISLYSYKISRVVKDENHKLFSLAFLSVAISLFIKIISNFTAIHRIRIEKSNFVYVILVQARSVQIIDFFSFIIYKILFLVGFIILLLVLTKVDKRERAFLFIYFSIIVVLLSIYFNFFFYITMIIILLFLTLHFHRNYKKNGTLNSMLVYLGFLLILISHFLFVFSSMQFFYIFGEVFMLLGFLCLLANLVRVFNSRELKKRSKKF